MVALDHRSMTEFGQPMHCDFCAAPDLKVWWRFPCETFTIPVPAGLITPFPIQWQSAKDYAACDGCFLEVEHADWDALARYVVKSYTLRGLDIPLSALKFCREHMWPTFHEHRTGKPSREPR